MEMNDEEKDDGEGYVENTDYKEEYEDEEKFDEMYEDVGTTPLVRRGEQELFCSFMF